MKNDNEKLIKWTSKDYARTMVLFFIGYFILADVLFLTTYVYDIKHFGEYFIKNLVHFMCLYGIIFIMFSGVYLYFYYLDRNFLYKSKNTVMIFTIIILGLVLNFTVGYFFEIYARPLVFIALLTLLLMGRRQAIFLHLISMIILFLMDNFTNAVFNYPNANYSSIIVGIPSGLFAIFAVKLVKSRLKILLAGFLILLPQIFGSLFLEGMNGVLDWHSAITLSLYGAVSSFGGVIFFIALLPLFEAVFNILTDYRLSELINHNAPLIKMLREKAPGTFNHSLVVANLVESCAVAIGENPQLARAGAYYHDVGKIKNSEYFKENQDGYNPHDELTPELSTNIIREHVKEGYNMIMSRHLPVELADFALQHHGTLPIKFFYVKALKFTDGQLDEKDFCYYGPNPKTKIAALIMIADAAEATVRTLADRSQEKVDNIVKFIIEERLELGQFDDSEITMQDLKIVRKTLVRSLASVYHQRVEYPNFTFTKR